MRVRLRLCDDCAVMMIREGFDIEAMKSYHPQKGSQCCHCDFRGYF